MEVKHGRGKPRIMVHDDIKANEKNEKIKRRSMDRECLKNWMLRNCSQGVHQWWMIMAYFLHISTFCIHF